MTQIIQKVDERFEKKYKQIASAIPAEVLKRCEGLAKNIKDIYNVFKENPSTVQ